MCRWTLYLSPSKEVLLSDLLVKPSNALTKQTRTHHLPLSFPWHSDNTADKHQAALDFAMMQYTMVNCDGHGIAWYANLAKEEYTPTLHRSPIMPDLDLTTRSLCATVYAKAFAGYIRWASAGMPVQATNTAPYVFGRLTFVNNGWIGNFLNSSDPERSIKKDIVDRLSSLVYINICGGTDSEHFVGLVCTILSELSGNPRAWESSHPAMLYVRAIEEAIHFVLKAQKKQVVDHHLVPDCTTLSFAVMDGEQMAALRFRAHKENPSLSLYWSEKGGFGATSEPVKHDMTVDEGQVEVKLDATVDAKPQAEDSPQHSSKDSDYIIVSSEPTSKEEDGLWNLVPHNSFVVKSKHEEAKIVPLGFDWEEELGSVTNQNW